MTGAALTGDGAGAADGVASGVDRVHAQLRRAILRGELAAGAAVSQVELAADLGISRTMLREALRMLQRDGLVRAEANRRVLVAPLSVDDVEGIYCARLSLEATAVRLTVPRLGPDEQAELEGTLAQLVHFARTHDYERWETVHRRFHAMLVAEGGARLTELLEQLSDHSERYRRLYTLQAPRAWSSGSHEHRMIADAVLAADPDLVARRAAAHLANTAFGVIRMLDDAHDARRLQETVRVLVGEDDPWKA